MITAYQGTADHCARSSLSTPLHLAVQTAARLRGCDRSSQSRKKCRHALQGNPCTLRSQKKEELLSRADK
jgi:hypothetical protein